MSLLFQAPGPKTSTKNPDRLRIASQMRRPKPTKAKRSDILEDAYTRGARVIRKNGKWNKIVRSGPGEPKYKEKPVVEESEGKHADIIYESNGHIMRHGSCDHRRRDTHMRALCVRGRVPKANKPDERTVDQLKGNYCFYHLRNQSDEPEEDTFVPITDYNQLFLLHPGTNMDVITGVDRSNELAGTTLLVDAVTRGFEVFFEHRNMIIYCTAGRNRSTAVVAVMFMLLNLCTFDEAYKHISKSRTSAIGMVRSTQEYLRGVTRDMLVGLRNSIMIGGKSLAERISETGIQPVPLKK